MDRLKAVEYCRLDPRLQEKLLEAASRTVTDAKQNKRFSYVIVAVTAEGEMLISESHQMRRFDV